MARLVLGDDGFKLLKKYKINTASYKLIKGESELDKQKYPLVLKVISDKIIHKTEEGAVKVCSDSNAAKNFFAKMNKKGYTIAQEFIDGKSIIIGVKKDESFGHVIMVGVGGIFAEIIGDISFRVCPITKEDAQEMISDLKAYPVLIGARGKKVNLSQLVDALVKVSNLAVNENVQELDINPFKLTEEEGKAVDIRIVI